MLDYISSPNTICSLVPYYEVHRFKIRCIQSKSETVPATGAVTSHMVQIPHIGSDTPTTRQRRYIKPLLTSAHKISCLEFVLTKLRKARGRWRFMDSKNVTHGDEKWFYMLKDGAVCCVFPNRDGIYKTPAT